MNSDNPNTDNPNCEYFFNSITYFNLSSWIQLDKLKLKNSVSSDSDFESATQIPKSALAASLIEKRVYVDQIEKNNKL